MRIKVTSWIIFILHFRYSMNYYFYLVLVIDLSIFQTLKLKKNDNIMFFRFDTPINPEVKVFCYLLFIYCSKCHQNKQLKVFFGVFIHRFQLQSTSDCKENCIFFNILLQSSLNSFIIF